MTVRDCKTCLYEDFSVRSDICGPCLAAPLMSRPNWTPAQDEVADVAPPADVRAYVADAAKRIVNGDRRGAYGAPENSFAHIARFWTAYFQNTGRGIAVTAQDVSPLMRLLKEARLCDNPGHLDSHVDLVGYALTGAEVNGVKVPVD
jgi:hypothetical protein